jgi:hypothetical protein
MSLSYVPLRLVNCDTAESPTPSAMWNDATGGLGHGLLGESETVKSGEGCA